MTYEHELNAWRELGEEMGRVVSLMPKELFEDWFPDWFGPRLFDLQLVATQVSPPTELGVCECGHGEGLHKFNYKNEPKQYRYDCRGCACENYRPKMSPPTPRWAEDAETVQPVPKIELHRCTICGTRWLLWPAAIHGGGWNLLDKWQRPGSCCDNVAMGDQIEHLRAFELVVSPPTPEAEKQR